MTSHGIAFCPTAYCSQRHFSVFDCKLSNKSSFRIFLITLAIISIVRNVLSNSCSVFFLILFFSLTYSLDIFRNYLSNAAILVCGILGKKLTFVSVVRLFDDNLRTYSSIFVKFAGKSFTQRKYAYKIIATVS